MSCEYAALIQTPSPLESALGHWYPAPGIALWRALEVRLLRQQSYTLPIIDLGCGDGRFAAMIFRSPSRLVGVDLDKRALAVAEQSPLYEQVIWDDLQQLQSVPSDTYATAFSNSVFEHIPNIDNALTEVHRVIQPGGKFIFTIVTREFNDLLRPSWRWYKRRVNLRYSHVSLFSDHGLQHKMREAGFVVERAIPYLSSATLHIWSLYEEVARLGVGRIRTARVYARLFRGHVNTPMRLGGHLIRRLYEQEITMTPTQAACMLYIARKPQ